MLGYVKIVILTRVGTKLTTHGTKLTTQIICISVLAAMAGFWPRPGAGAEAIAGAGAEAGAEAGSQGSYTCRFNLNQLPMFWLRPPMRNQKFHLQTLLRASRKKHSGLKKGFDHLLVEMLVLGGIPPRA